MMRRTPGQTVARLLPAFILLAFAGSVASALRDGGDLAWWQTGKPPRETHRTGVKMDSFYLPMRDGVRIAVDLYLPADLRPEEKLPAIFLQTRYFRAFDWYWPYSCLAGTPEELRRVVGARYAVVRTDVRGTGASFGTQTSPWSADEVRDGAEVVDWIVAQPWSSGKVGAVGGSYEGTSAEFLLVNRHPAVRAVAPMFSLFDVYTDIAFPGGILLEWFTKTWEHGTAAMDAGRLGDAAWHADFFIRGVLPVRGDRGRRLLSAAIREHAGNVRVHQEARQITFRDDVSAGGITMDAFSPHAHAAELRAAGAAILSYSGWFDGNYAHAAIKRFLTVAGPDDRLILGPWNHGGSTYVQQFGGPRKSGFDHVGQVLRFFNHHLKGEPTGIETEPPVHYFTMGEGRWKAAESWPPPGTRDRTWYLAADGRLSEDAPTGTGMDVYRVDLSHGTGRTTRWNALAIDRAVTYPDRERKDKKLLVYESAPLARDTEVTGHPLVTLHVTSTADDGEFFVYLEDVDERGRVGMVSEGMLRALHRKTAEGEPPYRSPAPYRSFLRADAAPLARGEVAELTFDLFPVSHLFRAGHRIRVAIAGADRDLFHVLPGPAPTVRIARGAQYPSRVVLPVME